MRWICVAMVAAASAASAEPTWTKVATAPAELELVNLSAAPGKDLVAGATRRLRRDEEVDSGTSSYALRLHGGTWQRAQLAGKQYHGQEVIGVWWTGDELASAQWGGHGDVGAGQTSSDGVKWTRSTVLGDTLSFRRGGVWWSGKLAIAAAGSSGIMRTTDGGHSWRPMMLPREPMLSAVWGNDNEIFAVGRSLWHSTDRGAHWSELRVKLLVELTSLTGSGNDLYAYGTDGGDPHTARMLHSTNGVDWTEVALPDKFAAAGRGDAVVVMANGELWLAAKGVWRSTDAGKHWTKQPLPDGNYPILVATDSAIYAVHATDKGDTIYRRE